jgi:hypothetical protein
MALGVGRRNTYTPVVFPIVAQQSSQPTNNGSLTFPLRPSLGPQWCGLPTSPRVHATRSRHSASRSRPALSRGSGTLAEHVACVRSGGSGGGDLRTGRTGRPPGLPERGAPVALRPWRLAPCGPTPLPLALADTGPRRRRSDP